MADQLAELDVWSCWVKAPVMVVVDAGAARHLGRAHDPIPSVWASRSRMVTATSADGGQGHP
jgi:hypothetical protein